jgi:hypothetical protein
MRSNRRLSSRQRSASAEMAVERGHDAQQLVFSGHGRYSPTNRRAHSVDRTPVIDFKHPNRWLLSMPSWPGRGFRRYGRPWICELPAS